MTRSRTKHQIDSLLTLLLFGVFAVCILSVLLTGAKVYRNLTQRDREAYDRRTCIQYIATKVRQAENAQSVHVEQFGDGDALAFSQELDGDVYLTWIYCYDGWLRELFCYSGGEFSPADGELVLEAERLELDLTDGLLSIEMTDGNGSDVSLLLSLRDGEGGLL